MDRRSPITYMSGPTPDTLADDFQPRFQLCPDLTPDTRCKAFVFIPEEACNALWVLLRQFTKCPRQCLHDHVVAIVDERAAKPQRTIGVARPTTSPRVERNCRHESETTTPSVWRTRPSMHKAVGCSPLAPRHPSDRDAVQVNRTPVRQSLRESIHQSIIELTHRVLMPGEQFEGDYAFRPRPIVNQRGHYGENRLRRLTSQRLRVPLPHRAYIRNRHDGQSAQVAANRGHYLGHRGASGSHRRSPPFT